MQGNVGEASGVLIPCGHTGVSMGKVSSGFLEGFFVFFFFYEIEMSLFGRTPHSWGSRVIPLVIPLLWGCSEDHCVGF